MPVFPINLSAPPKFGLSPADLGLPPKFKSWRPAQEQAMTDLMDWPGRFVILPIPAGGGKTGVYVGATAMMGWRTAITTSSKGLQDQLLDDFSQIGLVDVRGRQNFACTGGTFKNCETGYTGKCRNRMNCACPYYEQYSNALTSDIVVTNYDYWMAVHAHGKGLGNFNMLVADEAHNAPDHICQSASVTITDREVRNMLDKQFPTGSKTSMAVWREWARTLHPLAETNYARLKTSIDRFPDSITEQEAKQCSEWNSLSGNLARLSNASDYWGVKSIRNGYYMEPLIAADYAEEYLWRDSKRILLTSATLNLKTVEMLGISTEDYHYRNYMSDFPVINCRLIHVPTVSVKHSWTPADRLKWLARIDQIISTRTDRKGIIHTKSYDRAMDIFEHSKYRDMMITHEAGHTAAAADAFKESDRPCILVSPSIGTGYDFPDDQCRYQIITKVPFTDSRDPILKAREKFDPEYGMYLMSQDLVQMASRGNRSRFDWCENFVIDDLIKFAIFSHKKLFPSYFPALYFKSADRDGIGIVPPARALDGTPPAGARIARTRQSYSVPI